MVNKVAVRDEVRTRCVWRAEQGKWSRADSAVGTVYGAAYRQGY